MSEKKRTFKSETLAPVALRLEPSADPHEKQSQPIDRSPRRKSTFTPELIARLAERIKKL